MEVIVPVVTLWFIDAIIIFCLATLAGSWVGSRGERTRHDTESWAIWFGVAAMLVFELQCVTAG
jgi:hypothetical protein